MVPPFRVDAPTSGGGGMSAANSNPALLTFPVEIAVEQLYEQHRHLALVLGSLNATIDAILAGHSSPDLPRICAMIRYLDEFGGRVHCAVENEYVLTPMLLDDASDEVVKHVIEEHSTCTQIFATLQDSFETWRHAARRQDLAFPRIAAAFGAAQVSHLAFEENVLLPHALEQLPPDAWEPLVRAFESNPDPLFSAHPLPEFSALEYLRPIAHSLHPVSPGY